MNFKQKAMLAASMYANKATYDKTLAFVKDNWEEIAMVAIAAYLVDDIVDDFIDPDVLAAAEEGVLV